MFEVACFTSIHLPRLLLQSSGQVNSSKSMIGHCLGAAAGVEAASLKDLLGKVENCAAAIRGFAGGSS